MSPLINLVGQKFGMLTVIGRAPNGRFKNSRWECLCECGNSKITDGSCLTKRYTLSCGCTRGQASITHGLKNAPEYKVWANMKSRCENPRTTYFMNYGGRGISVCDSWRKFENFYADMGPRPTPAHTIDRKNNDGNYEPENCRWATRTEQARNTRVKARNLTGQIFGRLTALERVEDERAGQFWKCRCSCGKVKIVTACNLFGKTNSCGCLKSELIRARFKKLKDDAHAS